MKFIKLNKILMTSIVIVVIVILSLIIKTINNNKNIKKVVLTDKEKSVEVSVNYTDFSKHFKKTKSIIIANNSSNVKVYSIKWINVENTLMYQNKFLYEIKCEETNNTVGTSQMPVFDFVLFSDIYIEMQGKEICTITFTYKGREDRQGHFKGQLIAVEEITDQNKYKEYIKMRNKRLEEHDKMIKEYQKLDDK